MLFILILCILIGVTMVEAVTISSTNGYFYDGFESNSLDTNGWLRETDGSTNWTTTTATPNPHWDTYFARRQATASATPLISNLSLNVDVSNYTNVSIYFWGRTANLDVGENLTALWYNGTSWYQIMQVGTIGSWTQYKVQINNSDNVSNAILRFVCRGNETNERCGVDDVEIFGYSIVKPSIENLSLISTSGNNNVSDNLTCNYNLNGTAITSGISWYINNSPLYYYYLPMKSRTNYLIDYSGRGFNTSVNGIPLWQPNIGHNGSSAISFSQDIANSPSLLITESVTNPILFNYSVTFWANIIDTDADAYLFNRFNTPTDSYATSLEKGGGVSVIYQENTPIDCTIDTGYTPADNTWHFYAIVMNGTNRTIYIDNRKYNLTGCNGVLASDGENPFVFWVFNGYIENIKIWNKTLSSQQISAELNSVNNSNTIVSQELRLNDVWQCRVTPFDNVWSGNNLYSSNNVTITNVQISNPTISNLILNSTSNTNTTIENLTCNYNLNGSATTSVIAWYKNNNPIAILNMPFEGNSTNALNDYSGYNHIGTNNGGNWISNLGYDGNSAFNFSSADASIYFSALNLNSNNVTITARVKGTGNVDFAGIIFSRSGSTIAGLNYHSTGLRYHWNDDASTWGFNSGLTIPNDVWTFIALVITPNNATLYVNNNSVVNNFANSIEEFNGNTSIGDDTGFVGRYWIGSIDEVKILNYSMSRTQILALYNNQSNVIVSDDIKVDEIWQCRVTPFSSTQVGTTQSSNSLLITLLQTCDITTNTVFTLQNIVCDIFHIFSNVYVSFINSTLKQNATIIDNNSTIILNEGSAYV